MCKSACALMTLKKSVISAITPSLRCWASGHLVTTGNRIHCGGHWNGLHARWGWSRNASPSRSLQVIVTLPETTKQYRYGASWVSPRSVSTTCQKRTTGGDLLARQGLAVQTLNSSMTQVAQSMILIASRVATAENILRSATTSSCSTTRRRRVGTNRSSSAILTWVLAWNEHCVCFREPVMCILLICSYLLC